MNDSEQLEKVAALCHDQWSGWMRYLFSKCDLEISSVLSALENGAVIMPKWAAERWSRQMKTPYAELSEDEKESDRNEARKFLAMLNVSTG